MALLQNQRLMYQLPLRFRGVFSGELAEAEHTARRNAYAGGLGQRSAVPNGAQPGNALVTQQKGGGVASYVGLFGDATTSGAAAAGRALLASLLGSGDLTGTATKIAALAAALEGTGTLAGLAVATLLAQALLEGQGTVSGAAAGLGHLGGTAAGSGTVAGTPKGPGSISATIGQGSDPLSPAALADAVWSRALEAGYTAEQLLRLLAAVAAGKTTIVPGAPGEATVAFRDLADTKARVTAAMTGSTRASVSLDPT